MKKIAACFLILTFVFTGCTGTFHLTKAVNHFHRSQTKWADEAIFLCVAIFPVYAFAMLGDAVIFNTFEFWTGKNPIASTGDTQNTIASNDQEVEIIPMAYKGNTLILSQTNEGAVAMDNNGNVLFTSKKDIEGGVTVFDAENHVVNYFSPDVVDKERTQLFQN